MAKKLIRKRSLLKFDISHNKLLEEGVNKLSKHLPDCMGLVNLKLNSNRIKNIKEFALNLKENITITELNIENNEIYDDTFVELANCICEKKNFNILNISSNMIYTSKNIIRVMKYCNVVKYSSNPLDNYNISRIMREYNRLGSYNHGSSDCNGNISMKLSHSDIGTECDVYEIYDQLFCSSSNINNNYIGSSFGSTIQSLDLSYTRVDEKFIMELFKPFKILEENNKNTTINNTTNINSNNNNITSSLTYLNLNNNNINDLGAEYLSFFLKYNNSNNNNSNTSNSHNSPNSKCILSSLHLTNCNISHTGAFFLAQALTTNTSLKELILSDNKLHNKGLYYISNSLLINTTLDNINLGVIKINEYCSYNLSKMLKSNTGLKYFSIYGNKLGDKAMNEIFNALSSNKSIISFSAGGNRINDNNSTAIKNLLEKNTNILVLEINGNALSDKSVFNIAQGLTYNNRLVYLNIINNNFTNINPIVNAIQNNPFMNKVKVLLNPIKNIQEILSKSGNVMIN